jgi:SAM-dependent methyltransferase
MLSNNSNYCPICESILLKNGNPYSVKELFELWSPIQFSKEIVEEHLRQAEYTQLYSCPECKLEIFLPQIIGTSNFYLELQKTSSGSYYVDEKWEFDEALKDVKNFNSIIEIGCGPGNFLEKVKPYVAQVCGTEYNEHALRIARSKGLKVFGIDDENAAQMKGQFDAAFSFHVLEHVSNPVDFVQEILSWIKPGGKIGISVPNMDGPVKYINPCISNMPPHHATRWKLQTFKVLVEKLGLKIERVVYEPLIARDHYYYSYCWINHLFPDKHLLNRFLQFIVVNLFNLIFKILTIFNQKTLNLLNGLSFYLLMSKRIDR